MDKERNQNPVLGDDLRLRLVSFNSNNLADLSSVDQVEIYYLDPAKCSDKCPDGATLIQTVPGDQVEQDGTGKYSFVIQPMSPEYVIGRYMDVWKVKTQNDETDGEARKYFEIYPDLWYFSTLPAVYSFDFQFQPNRFRKGSLKYLIIKIIPNVPRATDLEVYYTNLAISSNLYIYVEKTCGPCPVDMEQDLNLIIDRELVDTREKVFAYYLLDTRELDCGIYNVWFELDFAGIIEVSPKSQIQIF